MSAGRLGTIPSELKVSKYIVHFPKNAVDDDSELNELFNKCVNAGLRVDVEGTVEAPQPVKRINISGMIRAAVDKCPECGGSFTGTHFCVGRSHETGVYTAGNLSEVSQ